jgi:hypothetical protein
MHIKSLCFSLEKRAYFHSHDVIAAHLTAPSANQNGTRTVTAAPAAKGFGREGGVDHIAFDDQLNFSQCAALNALIAH